MLRKRGTCLFQQLLLGAFLRLLHGLQVCQPLDLALVPASMRSHSTCSSSLDASSQQNLPWRPLQPEQLDLARYVAGSKHIGRLTTQPLTQIQFKSNSRCMLAMICCDVSLHFSTSKKTTRNSNEGNSTDFLQLHVLHSTATIHSTGKFQQCY